MQEQMPSIPSVVRYCSDKNELWTELRMWKTVSSFVWRRGIMVKDLKTYQLYQYFKLIKEKDKSLPEEKRPTKPLSRRFPGVPPSFFLRRPPDSK